MGLEGIPYFLIKAFVSNHHRVGLKLNGLPDEQGGVVLCRKHFHLKLAGLCPYHIQCLATNGTSRTQNGKAFFSRSFHQKMI